MKTSMMIKDGTYQISLHQENKGEEALLSLLRASGKKVDIVDGISVFACAGGYLRQAGERATCIVVRDA